jgi:hydrogenase maturation protein HypF
VLIMRIDYPIERPTTDGVEAGPALVRRVPAMLAPDLATCAACLEEVHTPGGRRHRYPFTNCSACGPRYSIATGLPYDRRNTSMRTFVMCNECAREYDEVDDRRHHAQPIACPTCGPALSFRDPTGRVLADGEEAFDAAVRVLEEGGVLGVRGVGGFQLVCNATDAEVVWKLRIRKRTPLEQPLSVMFSDFDQLAANVVVSDEERRALTSPEAPIVLVRRHDQSRIPQTVASNGPTLGVMLPCSALHALLLERIAFPLVCTSGNVSGEPVSTSTEEALESLAGIADGLLCHDRQIVRPLDDSLVQVTPRRTVVLRRARGYVPRSVARIDARATVLGVGARLKSTVTLGHRGGLISSQHLGDLAPLRSRELLETTIRDLCALFEADPTSIACDLHPDYGSTLVAEQLAERWGVPVLRVQHHHAHVAAVLAEHEVDLDEAVLGLAWDGPGLGTDGTLWGGEALSCQGKNFRRVGTLRPFPVLGGDRAAREPRRSALGLIFEAAPDELSVCAGAWSDAELASCSQILERQLAPMSSSIERLVDAVAVLIGLSPRTTYEGQSTAEMEHLAASVAPDGAYPLPLVDDGVFMGDTRPLVEAILEDLGKQVERARIARRLHESLIGFGVDLAKQAGLHRVALAGSAFQNRLLADGLEDRLERAGFQVLMPRLVPTNDGGVSVGQAWLAAQQGRREPGRS